MGDVYSICGYCGCGCGMYLHVNEGRVIGVSPSRHHPVSRNNLCAKGWQVYEYIHHPERLTQPLVRRKGRLRPASWDDALDLIAEKLLRIRQEAGADAIGLLSSARCSNEENYLMQKFARAVIGTNNIDHCARL